jgi:ubiquinone/menaquinone biosynthesis C-methylase UbiE
MARWPSPPDEKLERRITINNKMTTQINPNKALWEKGDFTQLAQGMRESGEALIEQLGISKAMRVLDLGCGDGTTAIPAAKTGATVLGVDIASNLVAAGNARAKQMGLSNITFQEGDACDLQDLKSGYFDQVVSIFGAMFAPRPLDVAREMVRVTKFGGKITMGNWIPGDPTLVAQILKISAAYTPAPPPGFISPMLWGVESEVVQRFEAAGIATRRISFSRDAYLFNFPVKPSELVNIFKTYYGPTMNAFEVAEKEGKADRLQRELEDLFVSQNTSSFSDHSLIPATFLRVTVVKM